MRILILADRDWLHPNTGGHGLHIENNVKYWTEWGHEVTIIAGRNPGELNVPLAHDVAVKRYGNRVTIHAIAAVLGVRNRLPAADVVLEYINGICWFTPLWLRSPSVTLVHHVHRDMYSAEFGRLGRIPALVAETLPLKLFYRKRRFIAVSQATKDELTSTCGLTPENISVVHPGVDIGDFRLFEKAQSPTMVFLGRLKAYKRVDKLITLLASVPDLTLDVIGDGDAEADLRRTAASQGVSDRVVFHGFVDHQRKNELLGRAWLAATCSTAEGWSSSTIEAAACGTPTIAYPIGGLRESIVHRETGLHVLSDEELLDGVRWLVGDQHTRTKLSRQARARALTLNWEQSARGILNELASVVESRRS